MFVEFGVMIYEWLGADQHRRHNNVKHAKADLRVRF